MKTETRDYILSWIVLLQPLLVIIQIILLQVFGIAEETATSSRVILTAVPICFGFILIIKQTFQRILVTYTIAILILLLNVIVFPQNEEYLLTESLRFLLPVVIPTALLTLSIHNYMVLDNVLIKVSWVITILVSFYTLRYLSGSFTIHGYNMGLSYALLLPMLALFSQRNIYSILAACFLFAISVILGSRSASIAFIVYVVYHIVVRNKKMALPMLLLGVFLITSLPSIVDWLSSIGLRSRTLELYMSGELTSYDSGRGSLQDTIIPYIWENPVFGNGLWGDRPIIHTYSHNIFIELYVHWGIFIGSIIIITILGLIITTFVKSDSFLRSRIILYAIGILLPMTVSYSYLTNYNLALFIGVIVLIRKTNNKKSS